MVETFSWDDVGDPQGLDVTDITSTVSHPYTGYSAARPAATKMQKEFRLVWEAMNPAQWLAFVEFWRSVYGPADAFYFEFPVEMYGSPGYGGYAGLEPADGFDADIDTGFGGGPAFTVRFVGDRLPQKYRVGFERWRVTAIMREVA